ncbi:MAG: sugar phosphate nucleotidyltransferase [Gemmatimonadaceae bacterium]
MSTTKAVVLARGLGTRMKKAGAESMLTEAQRRSADAGLKAMIPIDRPFLDYVLSALADAGITDVCLVVGPEHDVVRHHYSSVVTLSRVRVHFATQAEPRGTADAVAAAVAFAGDDTVLVLNADNYYPVDAYRALVALGASGLAGFDAATLVAESNIPEERIRHFALVESDRFGNLQSIVEKPDDVTYARLSSHALVSMNLWSFTPVIFDACARVQPSARGELELQDAVRIAREEFGEVYRVIAWKGGVLDLSSRRDIPEVATRLSGVEVRL